VVQVLPSAGDAGRGLPKSLLGLLLVPLVLPLLQPPLVLVMLLVRLVLPLLLLLLVLMVVLLLKILLETPVWMLEHSGEQLNVARFPLNGLLLLTWTVEILPAPTTININFTAGSWGEELTPHQLVMQVLMGISCVQEFTSTLGCLP